MWLWLILLGMAGGVLSGIFGIGGGILLVPALVALLGYSQKTGQGTVLLMLAIPVFLFPAVFSYYKAGNVNLQTALLLGLGFGVGGFLGAKIVILIPDNITVGEYLIHQPLKKLFAVLMLYGAYKMFTATT